MFLRKGVLKICSKFTGEQPSRSVISIKLKSNFVEITLQHVCSSVHLLHIFRAPFSQEHLWAAASEYNLLIHFFYSSCSGSSRMTNGSVLPKSYKYTTIIFPIVSNEFWQKCIYEQFKFLQKKFLVDLVKTAYYANWSVIFNFVATFRFIDWSNCCNFCLIWERITEIVLYSVHR